MRSRNYPVVVLYNWRDNQFRVTCYNSKQYHRKVRWFRKNQIEFVEAEGPALTKKVNEVVARTYPIKVKIGAFPVKTFSNHRTFHAARRNAARNNQSFIVL